MGKKNEESIKKQTLPKKGVQRESIWTESLNRVDEYHKNTGLWPSVHNPDANIARLGAWCTGQRGKLKRGILDVERKYKLDSINFEWSPEPGNWSETFEKVKEYHDKTDQWPSIKDKDIDVSKLGTWCGAQRSTLSGQRKYRINSARKEMLDSIGFVWKKNNPKITSSPKHNRDDLMRALKNKTIELGRELKRNDIDTDLSLPSYSTVLKITGLKFKELKKQIKK